MRKRVMLGAGGLAVAGAVVVGGVAVGGDEGDDGPASRFAGLAMPVLVMWGARSPAFLSGTAQRLREALPRGQGVELPGQGHNAPDITAPPVVARHIRRFLVA